MEPSKQLNIAPPISVSEFLRQQLNKNSWSVSELARRAGVDRSNLNSVVTESVSLSAPVGVKISIALGLPAETLLVIKARHQSDEVLKTIEIHRLGSSLPNRNSD
jgi:plasmid maintenance system antidote protein VapI